MDADKLCTITLHQAWIKFLIARAKEIQGRYGEAVEMYQHITRTLPTWQDPHYRSLVCNMKRGFTEKVSKELLEVINKNPSFFHKVIFDPELIRGQLYLISSLQRVWKEAYNRYFVEKAALEDLDAVIKDWFKDDDNPIAKQAAKVRTLLKHGEIKNYLLFFGCRQTKTCP